MLDHDLPILYELRADLALAFSRAEAVNLQPIRPRRRRWAMPAFGFAAAAVAAVAIALVSGADSGKIAPESANAAGALRKVAAVAATTPSAVPRDDQYYYVKTSATTLSPASQDSVGADGRSLVTIDREIWFSAERTGRLIDRTVGSRPLVQSDSGGGKGGNIPDVDIAVAPLKHYILGEERLTRAELLAFPTDPKTIFERVVSQAGGRGSSLENEVFTKIGDALRERPAPAALRAGMYRALALVPGIELVGAVTDRAGRSGTAVAFTHEGVRHELIFDPETSELLAERDVLADPAAARIDAPTDTVIGDAIYLRRAVTDDLKPPAG